MMDCNQFIVNEKTTLFLLIFENTLMEAFGRAANFFFPKIIKGKSNGELMIIIEYSKEDDPGVYDLHEALQVLESKKGKNIMVSWFAYLNERLRKETRLTVIYQKNED